YFRIGAGAKAVTACRKPGTKCFEVVDFTVEYDLNAPVLVAHRLASFGAEVDDGQAAMPKPHAIRDVDAVRIGAPMRQSVAHRKQRQAIDGLSGIGADHAAYSAHSASSLLAKFFETRRRSRGRIGTNQGPSRQERWRALCARRRARISHEP